MTSPRLKDISNTNHIILLRNVGKAQNTRDKLWMVREGEKKGSYLMINMIRNNCTVDNRCSR